MTKRTPDTRPAPSANALRSLALTGLISLVLVGAGILAYRHWPGLRSDPTTAPLAIPGIPRVTAPAPSTATTPPPEEDDRLTVFSPRDFGHRSRFATPITVAGPFEPLRGDTFTNEEATFALAGIEGPPATAICLGGDKRLWACGLQSRAALIGLLRNKEPRCTLVSGVPVRRPRDPGTARWNCRIDGRDLALLLVEAGWAKPAARDDRALLAARDRAVEARRGLWDGDWTIVRVPEP
jgi:endonuclease YncB( thermonuclease family)